MHFPLVCRSLLWVSFDLHRSLCCRSFLMFTGLFCRSLLIYVGSFCCRSLLTHLPRTFSLMGLMRSLLIFYKVYLID